MTYAILTVGLFIILFVLLTTLVWNAIQRYGEDLLYFILTVNLIVISATLAAVIVRWLI